MIFTVSIFVTLFIRTTNLSFAQGTTDIDLSEVYVCQGSGEKEWLELHNSSSVDISVANWKIIDNNSDSFVFNKTDSANPEKYLVKAGKYKAIDIETTNSLFNDNTTNDVKLFDSSSNLIDQALSMESCKNDNQYTWAKFSDAWKLTSSKTPNAANLLTTPSPSVPTPSPSPSSSPASSPTSAPSQPSNISLSEVYACQQGEDQEWVEIYNGNDSEVTLINWEVRDSQDNHVQPIPSLTIPKKEYKVISISEYDIGMFTNTGDTVRLFNGNKVEVDSYKYLSSCTKGSTWAKIGSDWKETTKITKGSANEYAGPTATSTATSSPTAKPSATPTIKPSTSPSLSPSPSSSASASPEATAEGDILGLSMEEPEPSPEPEESSTSQEKQALWPAFLAMGGGVTMVAGVGGYLGYDWYSKKYGKVPFKIPFLKSA